MIYRREDVRQLGFSCLEDEVAGEGLVLTIDSFVEGLDLGALHGRYSEGVTMCAIVILLVRSGRTFGR